MRLIRSKLLKKHKGSWLVETNECFIFLSKKQVSGFLNLVKPHYTDAYWDDPLLLSLIQEDASPLLVLGAGILSYLPQIRSKLSDLKITHVEYDDEIFVESQKIISDKGICNHNDVFLNLDAYNINLEEYSGHNVFIDIYTGKGIHPNSLDDRFLSSLAQYSNISAFNVFDTRFPEVGASSLFNQRLRKHFKNIVFVNRENSNTVFCSNKLPELKDKILKCISSYDCFQSLALTEPLMTNDMVSLDVLEFTLNDANKEHLTGPFPIIKSFFASLGSMDLIKASRNGQS